MRRLIEELEELTDPGRRTRIVLLNRKFFADIDLGRTGALVAAASAVPPQSGVMGTAVGR